MSALMRMFSVLSCLLMATPAMAMPPVEQAKLDNGLRVLLMQSHNVPMVSMSLSVPVGSWLDPQGKGGTAALLSSMLGDHTARHDYIAWADKLDAAAIRLGSSASRDSLSLSLTVLTEALAEGVDAYAEAALHPGWDAKRFAVLQSDSVSGAQKSLEEPGVRAAEQTAALLYDKHGYNHRSSGDLASLQRIELKDLQAMYAAQFKPQGAVLAVSGDVSMDELLALIRPVFSAWKGAPARSFHDIPQPAVVSGEARNINMPTRQMTVQLARLGPSRFDDAFFADMLLNHMFGGGGFSSRLMNEVREQRGLVYGVYSYFSPLAVPGPFVISLQTRADQAGKALAVVQDVMRGMHDGNISKAELDAAKANLTGGFAHRLDSNAKRVGLLSMIGYYGLPLDYLQAWERNINAVSLQAVKHEAKRFLDPEHWNIIQAGPTDGIQTGLTDGMPTGSGNGGISK